MSTAHIEGALDAEHRTQIGKAFFLVIYLWDLS